MFEKFIENFILNYFGDYIENFDKNNISAGIWAGHVVLEGVLVKPSSINAMKLPFKFIYGRIGKLDVTINWKSNFSEPTVIIIENLHVVVSLIKQGEWDYIDYISFESKMKYLNNFASATIMKIEEAFALSKKKAEKSEGYLDRVAIKVLDNLQITFRNIHFRIEDTNISPEYSLGITLQEMIAVNTNENWEQVFIDRSRKENKLVDIFKLLKISDFGVYLKLNETSFLSRSKKELIQKEMELLFPKGNQSAIDLDYLIQPMSMTAKMRQRNDFSDLKDSPIVTLWINLEKFNIDFQKTQFDCLIRILNISSYYQRFQFNYYETRRYNFIKPKFRIHDKENRYDIFKSKTIKNHNCVMWWKFAIRTVIKRQKFIRGSNNEFDIPIFIMKEWKKQFSEIYKIFYKNPNLISNEQMKLFRKIVSFVELQELYKWVSPILQEIDIEIKKEQNKKQKTSIFGGLFGSKLKDEVLLSPEEIQIIEKIFNDAVSEITEKIITNKDETKLQVHFHLNEGFFNFSQSFTRSGLNKNIPRDNQIIGSEAFCCKYRNLKFNMKKGENFTEIETMLKEFSTEMVTIINNNETILPITFINDFTEMTSNQLIEDDDRNYIWKLNFRQNSPLDEINSILRFQINKINLLYHQTFLDRVISFFSVEINQDLVNQAWDKWNIIKEKTSSTIKAALTKKNILEVNIEPRKLIIPINKYDFKNSKILTLELGQVRIFNSDISLRYDDNYKLEFTVESLSFFNAFSDMILNEKRLVLIPHILASMTLSLKPLNLITNDNPKILLCFEISNIIMNMNNYLYTILNYIMDIMKPTKELDLWSQIIQSKQEIKRNCKAFGKIMKKSESESFWKEYYGVLSGGYIYFFKDVNDDKYIAYYYIKDTVLSEEIELFNDGRSEGYLKLKNPNGIIKLKFPNDQKKKNWIDHLKRRIFEMNISYEEKKEQLIESKAKQSKDMKEIFFGAEIRLLNITMNLFEDESDLKTKIFTISLRKLDINLKLRSNDSQICLGLQGFEIFDEKIEPLYRQIIDSTDPNDTELKLVSVIILICDELSPKYENVQIKVDLIIGYLYAIWNPNSIRKLLSFLAHHDIYRDKILKEIQLPPTKTQEDKFVMPLDDEEIKHITCSQANSIYYKVTAKITNVRVIWLQPTQRFMFMEARLGETNLYCDSYVDHLEIQGTLGNTQIFDLSNYPYTIKTQEEYDSKNMKEILGFEQKSSLDFKYKSYSGWCPHYKDNNCSHCTVIFNSGKLTYIHELFFRFFNYLFEEFLGSIGANQEVRDYRDKKNQVKVREKNDIEFMILDVTFKNPQVVVKPRPGSNEYMLVDFGTVHITNTYLQTKGKNRKFPNEVRWLKIYNIDLKQLYIIREDNFKLCNPTDAQIELIFHHMTWEEYKLSDVEIDKSLEINLTFQKIELNLRQIDFTNLMRCNDLNIMYTDNMYKYYLYSQINSKEGISQEKILPVYTDDNLLSMLVKLSIVELQIKLFKDNFNIITELVLINKILVYKKTLTNKSDLVIKINKSKVYQYISNEREGEFISDFNEVESGIEDKDMESSNDLKRDQININYMMDAEREKTVLININDIKVFIRIDIMNLIKIFFLEGFPSYENAEDRDLPNMYDPNTDNYPGMRVFLEIKNPLLCVLSETVGIEEQDLICLTCEIVMGYRKEKVKKIKEDIKTNYHEITKLLQTSKDQALKEKYTKKLNEDKSETYSLKISLIDICPFISNKFYISTKNKAFLPKRKLMDSFMFTYEYSIILRYIPENQYIVEHNTAIDLNKINIKLTYRDLVLFLKSIEFNNNLLNDDYAQMVCSLKQRSGCNKTNNKSGKSENIEKKDLDILNEKTIYLKSKSKEFEKNLDLSNIVDINENNVEIMVNTSNYHHNFLKNLDEKDIMIDKGMSKFSISSRGCQIILIDDHANTYYPFLSIIIYDVVLINEYINLKQNIINASSMIKVITYNYLAGVWEPIIEKTMLNLEIVQDCADEKISSNTFNITIPINKSKQYSAFNINISDLTICFLYSTMNSWIDKYWKLKDTYSEEISKILYYEKDMKISNHTIFNYTGKNLVIYKVLQNDRIKSNKNIQKLFKKLIVLPQNQSFDIDYFDENNESDLNLNMDITQNLFKENIILFELEDIDYTKITDSELKIDLINIKKHKVNYQNHLNKFKLNQDSSEKYQFIFSDIKFSNLTKSIYLYSPLIIKNKSPYTIFIKLRRKEMNELSYFIETKKTVGIPFEYLDGEIEFSLKNLNQKQIIQMKELLNLSRNKNLRFQEKNINLFKSPFDPKISMNVVTITSSYILRNCLPYDIEITIIKTGEKIFLPKSEKMYIDTLTTEDNLEIHLKFLQFRNKREILLYNSKAKEHLNKPIDFIVYDDKNLALTLFAALVEKTDSITIAIYCKGLIINNTMMNIGFYYNRKNKLFAVAGQKEKGNVFLISDETHISLETEELMSEPYSLNAIGISTMVECKNENKVYEFVMKSELSLVSQDLEVYTTIITFSPRFILYNKLNVPLVIKLKNYIANSLNLLPNEKKPFFFFGQRPNNLICFRPIELREKESTSGSVWNYSNGISLINTNLLTIQVISNNKKEKKFINMEKKIEGSSTFVIVNETNYENSQFIIENFSRNISFRLYQENLDMFSEYIDIFSKSIFAWDHNVSNVLCFEFLIGPLKNRPFSTRNSHKKIEIFDDRIVINKKITLNYPGSQILQLRTSKYSGFALKLDVSTDGMRKILKFSDIIYDVYKFSDKKVHILEIHLKIEKLGISIISDNRNINKKRNEYTRYEICYISLNNIYYYSKKTQIEGRSASDIQLKIQDAQIDNQYAYIVSYPIILKALDLKSFSNLEVPPVFNMVMYSEKDKMDNLKINLFNYLIQSCSASLDSDLVEAFMNFFVNITVQLKTSLTQINPIFILPNNTEDEVSDFNMSSNYLTPDWLIKNISKDKSKIFIQTLKTSSIDLVLSFSAQNKNKAFAKYLTSSAVLSSILGTLSNLEKAPIMLNGSEMHNIHGDISEIISLVMVQYKQATLVQVMKIFGAIDLLGNPINLLNNVGTGVQDFFQKPIQGIIMGPLEGVKGVVAGSVSLVKHTVGGTFTATSKITSGISKGILSITQDDDYINDRETKKITEKPKNFVEGLGFGISSMATGLYSGVTDLVSKPIQGAKQENFTGFGKGLLKGFAGLVVKPVSGVLDLFSKTTEGIKNTMNSDDISMQKQRKARAFYGRHKIVKSYNAYHADVIELLNKMDEIKKRQMHFYSSEIYKNKKEEIILMVLTTKSMILIDLARKELKTEIPYSFISKLEIQEQSHSIKFHFKELFYNKSAARIELMSEPKLLFNKIKDAIDNNQEYYN